MADLNTDVRYIKGIGEQRAKALGKLDRLSDSLNGGREAEKGGRSSIKDKLSQMKARADQQKKAPEPEKARAKGKEECL